MKGVTDKELPSEDEGSESGDMRIARGMYLTGEEPDDGVTHLSDARLVARAPCPATEFRFGLNPNLTKKN